VNGEVDDHVHHLRSHILRESRISCEPQYEIIVISVRSVSDWKFA
jgi:hypothetical protein